MSREGFGYFTCRQEPAEEGLRYAFGLSDGREYPDPASRWQPDGVHRPSALYFPEDFAWSDGSWRGVPREDLVLYELHVGTFTPEGTLDAVIPRLSELASLGVTALELMPLAQFPGERDWGYDGVHPYAVQNSYGGPHALCRLIDAAHRRGLAVILDVVYNHLGPEGNYLGHFGPYFSDRYHTPWGSAVNFDGPDSDPVRQFFIDNACAWVRDFHADGLRLDAVQTIYDFSAEHILADIRAAVQREAAAQDRLVHVIAETNQNDVRLVRPASLGGYGLDAVWADDFHHSVHALLTGQRDGYYQDFGEAQHLAKALRDVFVYDGCYSRFRRRRHGSRVGDLDRTHFVTAIQNHDQVGNRAAGDRLATLLPPGACRLACCLLLLSPCVPLLFMGEEYGEARPFPFFCSFGDPQLVESVRRGRQREFAHFEPLPEPSEALGSEVLRPGFRDSPLAFAWQAAIPDPQSPKTFAAARLQWAWPGGSPQERLRRLYGDLLAARRRWPGLRDRRHTAAGLFGGPDGEPAGDAEAVLVLERGMPPSLLACANLTPAAPRLPPLELAGRTALLSTEESRYGGTRSLAKPIDRLNPYEVLIFGPSEWRL